jgi:hypothetical protein
VIGDVHTSECIRSNGPVETLVDSKKDCCLTCQVGKKGRSWSCLLNQLEVSAGSSKDAKEWRGKDVQASGAKPCPWF